MQLKHGHFLQQAFKDNQPPAYLIMKNTRLTQSQEIVAFYKHRRTGLLACFD